jgi:ABC-type sugar transport system ATPase subunit
MTEKTLPVLEMRDISKSFFGVKVLDRVKMEAYGGEVLALLGQNGAGKSTLIKILNGDYNKDEGQIFIEGQPVEIHTPREAEELGIQMIYQELHFAPELSVAENLLLNHMSHRTGAWKWMVDWGATYERSKELLDLLQVDIDPRLAMRELGAAQKQIVQIAKALSSKARILVMDEPTAALTPREVDLLFETIDRLRSQGVAIIYISHRLDEIFRVAQRVMVLRDGHLVGTVNIDDIRRQDLVRMMVGHDVEDVTASMRSERGEITLQAQGLGRTGIFEDIDLEVHASEIVGLFGLLGAGHVEVSRALFGAEPAEAGEIRIDGKAVDIRNPATALDYGLGFVPAERKVEGLVNVMSVRGNTTLSNWEPITKLGFFREQVERQRVNKWVERLGIRMSGSIEQEVRFLSGGNQQKVMLGRWLEANTRILILNEPTWGVDVGARADIHALLQQLKAQGFAILIVSSDMEEVLGICDRILVMNRGRITAHFNGTEISQAQLLNAAAGEEA